MATRHVHGSTVWPCKPWCFFLDVIRRKSPCVSFVSSIKLNPGCYTSRSQHLLAGFWHPSQLPLPFQSGCNTGQAVLLRHSLSLDVAAFSHGAGAASSLRGQTCLSAAAPGSPGCFAPGFFP